MAMRPSALSALLLVALTGCGVPPPPADLAMEASKPTETKPEVKKPEEVKPVEPTKVPEEDPAKLGLGIVDAKVGTGAGAEPGDTCYMLYTGTLKDGGKMFDSTSKRDNKPFSFELGQGQVIRGWDLGIKGMKVGGKRTLTIPSALAYGAEAKGDDIPANSDLNFDIELVGLLKKADADTVVREVVKPGTGPAAKEGDEVSITYKGTLMDGTTFDDQTKKPVVFKIGAGITSLPGLEAAVTGMKVGETIRATVPPSLGFGPQEKGNVPPNSVLKFEITLVKLN